MPPRPTLLAGLWFSALGFSLVYPLRLEIAGAGIRVGLLGAALFGALSFVAHWISGGSRSSVDRLVLAAAAVDILPRSVSAFWADAPATAWMNCAEIAVWWAILAVGIRILRDAGARRVLGIFASAALVLLFAHAVASALGFGAAREPAHDQLFGLARPRPLGMAPFSAGVVSLVLYAIVAATSTLRVRRLAACAGCTVALLSPSYALAGWAITLLWPAAAFARSGGSRVILRVAAVGLVVASAAALHIRPVALRIGDTGLHWPAHANWAQDGLGPRHQPIWTASAGPLSIRAHTNGYGRTASCSIRCFAAAPILGLGGRNLERSCPCPSMNSLGFRAEMRRSHNAYLGLLAEFGLLGLLGALSAAALLWRIFGPAFRGAGHHWHGAVLGFLLCGMAGMILHLPLFAAAVAVGASVAPAPPKANTE